MLSTKNFDASTSRHLLKYFRTFSLVYLFFGLQINLKRSTIKQTSADLSRYNISSELTLILFSIKWSEIKLHSSFDLQRIEISDKSKVSDFLLIISMIFSNVFSLYVSLFLSKRETSILPLKLLLDVCLNEVKFDLSFFELIEAKTCSKKALLNSIMFFELLKFFSSFLCSIPRLNI